MTTETATAVAAATQVLSAREILEQTKANLQKQYGVVTADVPEVSATHEMEDVAAVNPNIKMEGNPFYEIMYDKTEGITKQQRIEAVLEARTYDKSKNAKYNTDRVEAYEDFKAYELFQWRMMQEQILKSMNTKAASLLKGMLEQVTEAMIKFDGILEPWNNVIKAVATLRKDSNPNIIEEIYKSFAEDETNRRIWVATKDATQQKLDQSQARLKGVEDRITFITVADKPKIFGKVKGEYKVEYAKLLNDQKRLKADLYGSDGQDGSPATKGLVKELKELQNPPAEKYAGTIYEEPKRNLRKLTQLSGEEWDKNAEDLKDIAINRIHVLDQQGNEVLAAHKVAREDLNVMIGDLTSMRDEFSILNEAEGKAREVNAKLVKELESVPVNEQPSARSTRLSALEGLSLYVNVSNSSGNATEQVASEIEIQMNNLQTFRTDNYEKVSEAQQMVSSALSQLATATTMAIFAVNSAGISQAHGIAKDAINKGIAQSDQIILDQLERIAENHADAVIAIQRLTGRLQNLDETNKKTKEDWVAAIVATDEAMKALREQRQSTEGSRNELYSAAAKNDASKLGGDFKASTTTREQPAPANDGPAPSAVKPVANRPDYGT